MKVKFFGVVMSAVAVMLLQGCTGGENMRGDVPIDERSIGADGRAGSGSAAQSRGMVMEGQFAGRQIEEVLHDPSTPLYKRVFYFDYNSAELSADDREALATHARFMNEVRDVTLVLEGHADERGSREYNLALGERRAKVIERVLSLQGVNPGQIQVISFGEERPQEMGHDEQAWRLNRRVQLLYSGY